MFSLTTILYRASHGSIRLTFIFTLTHFSHLFLFLALSLVHRVTNLMVDMLIPRCAKV